MRKRGVLSAEVEIKVPFYDVDSIQVVWHGHYLKYMEQARCALLDQLGYNYDAMHASRYAWPVIEAHLRYVQAARFGQRLRIRAELIEWQHRLKLNYLIVDAETGVRLTRASTVQVAVDLQSGEMQWQSPPALIQAVARARHTSSGKTQP